MQFKPIFTIAALLIAGRAFSQSEISDADGNTRVQTEAAPNDDKIRFKLNNFDALVMRRNPSGFIIFDAFNGGACTFLGEKAGEAGTSGGVNTFIGFNAGKLNTEGNFNTFLGGQCGQSNTTGVTNTFLAANAGTFNTTGSSNVFVGESAGNKNTTGSLSVFIGKDAGRENTVRNGNVFIGANAGKLNTNGDTHVFIGFNAGAATVSNTGNTFIGFETGLSSTSGANTYIGSLSGRNNTTGGGNTFMGFRAGQNVTTGTDNVIVGNQPALSLITGRLNVFVGRSAGPSTGSASGIINSTALGNTAVVNTDNKMRFGNTAVTVIEGQVPFSSVSDGRFKKDVKNDAPGLEFVLGLNPVTYHFDYTGFSKFLREPDADTDFLMEKGRKRETGFIAQEVEALCRQQGVDVSNLVHAPENEADNYSIAYGQMVVPLVKAVQEQQAQIEAQQAEIETLKTLVQQLLTAQTGAVLPAETGFSVWPNPVGDQLQVRLDQGIENATLSVQNTAGVTLISRAAKPGRQTIDLKNLPSGTYFIQLRTPGKPPVVQQIIKS